MAVLGLLLAVQLPRYALSAHALLGLGALALLAAWTGLSASWSPAPDAALADLQRDLLYVALFGLGLLAAGSGRHAALVGRVVLAVIVVIVGAGLLSRFAPHLVAPDPGVPALTNNRLAYPLSYWNAYGALAAVGAVLAAGMSSDPRAPVARARALRRRGRAAGGRGLPEPQPRHLAGADGRRRRARGTRRAPRLAAADHRASPGPRPRSR